MKRKRNYHDSIIKANGLKVIQHINDMGYTLLSEYTGTRFKINLRCPEGHDWSTWWEVLKRGGTCPKCQYLTRSSKSEDEVLLWLQEEGYTVEPQFKLEEYYYDIFIPSHKLLIEYHGLYWHSLDIAEYINSEKGSLKLKKHKHLFKYQVAQNNGLEVIQIWSDLWDNQKEAIKSIILNKLNSPKIKSIYARKCEIKPVSVKEAQIFYKSNHYQGSGSNNIESYGLYYQNQLVMLASISDHHRQSNVKIKVLSRVCTLKYHRVVGGMSRLIKKLPKPLISWSDNLYSSGKSYEKLGFKLVQELPPDYQYTTGHIRIGKQNLRKTEEEKKSGETEFQLRAKDGYKLLFDAGKKKWMLGELTEELLNEIDRLKEEKYEERKTIKKMLKEESIQEMRNKRTLKIFKFLETKQYKLISKEVNSRLDRLELSCPENHIFTDTYSNLIRYKHEWCPICRENIRTGPKQITKDMIEHLRLVGFTPLDKEYINVQSKIQIKCLKCSYTVSCVYRDHKKYTCLKCNKPHKQQKQKEDAENYIIDKAKSINAEVLRINKHNVELNCLVCHMDFQYSLSNYSRVKCPLCLKRKRMLNTLEEKGFQYLSGELIDSRSVIEAKHIATGRILKKPINKI